MNARLVIAAALCLVSPLPVLAQSSATIDEYMQKSGLVQLVAQVKDKMLMGIDRAQAEAQPEADVEKQMRPQIPKLTPEQLARLRGAVIAAYDADRLRDSLRSNLGMLLPGGDTEAVLRWLDSPLGKRVTTVELAAMAPEKARRAPESGGNTPAEVSPSRRADLDRMARTSGVVEAFAIVVLAENLGISRGIAAVAGTPMPSLSESGKSEYLRRYANAAANAWVAGAAVAYAPLTDAELGEYAAVLERASQRRVLDATSRALDKTLSSAVVDLLRRLEASAPPAAPKPAT